MFASDKFSNDNSGTLNRFSSDMMDNQFRFAVAEQSDVLNTLILADNDIQKVLLFDPFTIAIIVLAAAVLYAGYQIKRIADDVEPINDTIRLVNDTIADLKVKTDAIVTKVDAAIEQINGLPDKIQGIINKALIAEGIGKLKGIQLALEGHTKTKESFTSNLSEVGNLLDQLIIEATAINENGGYMGISLTGPFLATWAQVFTLRERVSFHLDTTYTPRNVYNEPFHIESFRKFHEFFDTFEQYTALYNDTANPKYLKFIHIDWSAGPKEIPVWYNYEYLGSGFRERPFNSPPNVRKGFGFIHQDAGGFTNVSGTYSFPECVYPGIIILTGDIDGPVKKGIICKAEGSGLENEFRAAIDLYKHEYREFSEARIAHAALAPSVIASKEKILQQEHPQQLLSEEDVLQPSMFQEKSKQLLSSGIFNATYQTGIDDTSVPNALPLNNLQL